MGLDIFSSEVDDLKEGGEGNQSESCSEIHDKEFHSSVFQNENERENEGEHESKDDAAILHNAYRAPRENINLLGETATRSSIKFRVVDNEDRR